MVNYITGLACVCHLWVTCLCYSLLVLLVSLFVWLDLVVIYCGVRVVYCVLLLVVCMLFSFSDFGSWCLW